MLPSIRQFGQPDTASKPSAWPSQLSFFSHGLVFPCLSLSLFALFLSVSFLLFSPSESTSTERLLDLKVLTASEVHRSGIARVCRYLQVVENEASRWTLIPQALITGTLIWLAFTFQGSRAPPHTAALRLRSQTEESTVGWKLDDSKLSHACCCSSSRKLAKNSAFVLFIIQGKGWTSFLKASLPKPTMPCCFMYFIGLNTRMLQPGAPPYSCQHQQPPHPTLRRRMKGSEQAELCNVWILRRSGCYCFGVQGRASRRAKEFVGQALCPSGLFPMLLTSIYPMILVLWS